ncbi:hypothetical protein LDENG_00107050 [Lucifuga dentata]|nr:hypothetical protein LDENG_00107050 [Lucifuga dentata]
MLSSHPDSTTAIASFMAHSPKSSANFSMFRTLLLGSSLTPVLVTTLPVSYRISTGSPSLNESSQTPPHHI